MCARYLSLTVCPILLTCSCANKADLDKAQDEIAKLKADLDSLRTELGKEKGDAAKVVSDAEAAKARRAKHEVEMMNRWNATVGGTTYNIPNWGAVTFRWGEPGNFPHPTFKGGSAEAYGAFAQALQAFLEDKGNFDYLAENQLFTAELRTSVPGGSGKGTGWSLANFAAQFLAPGAHGNITEERRAALKSLSDKIQAVVKKQENRKL